MSLSPTPCENSPELAISDVCRNLESQFTQDLSKAESMQVFARVRPMLNSEVEAGYKACIGTINDETIRAVVPSSSVKYKNSSYQDITEDFKFTAAYGPEVGQFVFFQESMMNTMQNFIEGQNSLVFSYGITGSGKTFTLQGDIDNPGIIPLSLHLFFASVENQLLNRIVVKPDKFAEVNILNDKEIKEEYQMIDQLFSNNNEEEWSFRNASKKSLAVLLCETFSDKFESDGVQTTLGIEEMAQAQAATLMKELSKKSAKQQNGYCSVWVSFAEIYNEHIYDLLQPNVNQRTKLTLGEDKTGDVYVKGLREVCVFNSFEALKLLNIGQKNLKIASTKLNYQSSRSHCIFTIKVVRIPDPENITWAKVSRLSFCDLAGSERASKSQTTGLRLKEAGCINTSLLVLGRCLEQLRLNPSLRDKKRVPFRESKLTRLLSGFFTGRGKAVMITNASPSEVTFDETLHALRFSALATELIINDSYIATASNTLQTITNMWTNARCNGSMSSDKSISFEESTVDVLQEKDEIIEKLLDLAESLTNNLEKEKKEKAELEIKIRREVCQEYSEYSDDLLERQKNNYEEEQEAIKEIYKKRIARLENMYESIIKDLKSQMEESDSSCDEAAADSNLDAMNNERRSTTFKNSFNGDTKEYIDMKKEELKNNVTDIDRCLSDMNALKEDLQSVCEELKKAKEELERSKDYCLSLESATEDMEKKLEISNSNLEKALSENCELRIKIDYLQARHENTVVPKEEMDNHLNEFETLKEQFDNTKFQLENTLKINEDLKVELDAIKIDCVSYKADNNDLFKKKTVMEEQLKSLTEELAFTKSEKEDLYQKLTESEKNATHLGKEVDMLLKRSNELNKLLVESKAEYENSLEEAKKEAKDAEEVLKTVNQTFDMALLDSEEQKKKLVVFETECAHLKDKNADILKKYEDLEVKYSLSVEELEIAKNKIKFYNAELQKTVKEMEKLNKELDIMKSECLQFEEKVFTLQETTCNLEENLEEKSSVIKELESEKIVYKQEIEQLNCNLNEALSALEEEKIKIAKLQEEKSNCEKEISELQESNKELIDKYSLESSKAESEVLACKVELEMINSKLTDALSTLNKQKQEVEDLTNEIISYKNEISDLQKQNKELMNNTNSQAEPGTLGYKEELDAVNSKLEEALSSLDKQKLETENLKNIINSDKTEITLLQKQNKELQDSMNSQIESRTLKYKEELDAVNNKLEEALSAVDKQTLETENLKNIINSHKMEISVLQKQNEELQDSMNSQTDYKKELDAATRKLDEALSLLDKQKQETETLTNVIHSDKKEIAELQNENKELQEKLNLEIELKTTLKQECDSVKNSLEEASGVINKKEEELQHTLKQIPDLAKLEAEFQAIMNSQTDLIEVLQKCELQATNKMDKMQSYFAKFKDENGSLKELIEKNSDNHGNELNILHKMIQILQYCEMLASNKIKTLHSSSIKHVEQIMDLENCIKQRNGSIEGLKNDYNLLQKHLKDFQAVSKKQLQTVKQVHLSEIDDIKTEKIVIEKENESLKNQMAELEATKDTLESEVKSIKEELEKVNETKNQLEATKDILESEVKSIKEELEKVNETKNQVAVKKVSLETGLKESSKTEPEKVTEGKKKSASVKEFKIDAKKSNNSKENADKKSKQKDEVRSDEKSVEKRALRKTMKESGEMIEEREKKSSKNAKNQNDKRKNKSKEKSGAGSEDKKLKTLIYEEEEENSNQNNENSSRKVRSSNRKQLRCVENVPGLVVLKNEDLTSSKNKVSKRKGLDESLDDKIYEKKTLKKIKLQNMNEMENISNLKKPQNLRIQLLKASDVTNDIPLPSPRMTRGRKKLCNLNAKNISQSKGSPRTVRS